MARRKPSIIYQVLSHLDELKRFGQSKHLAKQQERERCRETGERYNPARVEGIYSYATYAAYKKHCLDFANWARDRKGAKTLEQAREHVREYLQEHIREGRSAWTVRLKASALAKLYGCNTAGFGVELPKRQRENIRRSRGEKVRDRDFLRGTKSGYCRFLSGNWFKAEGAGTSGSAGYNRARWCCIRPRSPGQGGEGARGKSGGRVQRACAPNTRKSRKRGA